MTRTGSDPFREGHHAGPVSYPKRNAEEAAAAEAKEAAERRAASVGVCDMAIRQGCSGPGCHGPGHSSHAEGIRRALYVLGLAEDPARPSRVSRREAARG